MSKTKHSLAFAAMTNRLAVIGSKYGRVRQVFADTLSLNTLLDGMEQVALNRLPSDTPESHAKKVADLAKKLETKAAEKLEAINRRARETRKEINDQLQSVSNLMPMASGQEIRSILRGMSESERITLLSKAVKELDVEVLSAIFNGHQLATGINQDAKNKLIESYQHSVAPELVEERKNLDEIMESVPMLMGVVMQAASEAYDPRYIQVVTDQEKAAREAQAKFDNAMRGEPTSET